ncbi:MAG: ATP-binding cassette domain-containing protein [Gammaproteobacteria bacterium]|jgi:putative ABC transport system ATP-binding protein|nr:ATP-binding cassette domain-containing protein [Gammaproteobacteria bacterium]MBK7521527.1 ATP-binding cassette domain-containing protein [Gammaproteobacteria bacterium]MBK8307662.1 ATP-binding cassette domain-containing protein [Gammaproteobacteria bacterium]MBK9668166.1 ATP-binding cassette domain-containing protein [Gammaproteobacteria bacterium]
MKALVVADHVDKEVATAGGGLGILKGISLEINPGEAVAIVGASGSGKSTLLGLLAGLDLPSAGTIHVDGVEITALDEDARAALRGRMVGFVFQSFQLLPGLSAMENVMLPLEIRGDRDAAARAREFLDKVGLAERLGHYPRQLSGGEQQRVAIARAFASAPRLLFADEPTGNLDAATGARIIDLILALRAEQGATLVLVTHDERLASRCDRRLALAAGRLLAPGSSGEATW